MFLGFAFGFYVPTTILLGIFLIVMMCKLCEDPSKKEEIDQGRDAELTEEERELQRK